MNEIVMTASEKRQRARRSERGKKKEKRMRHRAWDKSKTRKASVSSRDGK